MDRDRGAETRHEPRGAQEAHASDWMRKLVQNFGDDEGNEVTFNGTVVQALLMMNGRELNAEVQRPTTSTVDKAMTRNKTPKGVVDELFLAALGRHVRQDPRIPITDPKTKQTRYVSELDVITREMNSARDPRAFFQDVFWALLNTNEFILNH